MEENNFIIDLIASLKKSQSKKQIQTDAKKLGNIKVPLIGTLNKSKTRAQIKQDLASLNGTLNLTGKVDKKGVDTSVKEAVQQAQRQAKSQPIQMDFSVKKDKLINDIKLLGKQNSKLFKDTGMSQKYTQLLDSAKLVNSSKELQNLKLQLGAFRSELKVTGNAGMTLIDALKNGLSKTLQLFGSYGIIMQFTKHLKNAWREAKELDESMTDLSRVNAEISRSGFPAYLDKVIGKTKELAVATKDYIDAVTTFSRAGYNLADSETLADMAVQLEKVGNMDATSASKALLAGLQGYTEIDGYGMDQLAEKAQALNDKIDIIGNTASITQKEVAEGIQAVGSVMNDANTSVDEFIAMLGAGNRAVQDSNKVALAIRTSALRIRGCTVELQEMGEETDNVIESTSILAEKIKALTNINGSGGVNILEADEETFRSIYDIYNDIAKVYSQMSDTDASALLELIAGKHRSNQVSSILQNMAEANELLNRSLGATGTASNEYQIYLDSAQAATERFGVAMTETYSNVINGETVKSLANAGAAVLNFANSFGIMEGTLKGFLVFGVLKGITTLTVAFKNSALQASNFGKALNTANELGSLTKNTKDYADAMDTLKKACVGLTDAQLKQVLSNNNLSYSEQVKILRYRGLTKAEAEAKLAQMGFTNSTNAQTAANEANTASTFSLRNAMRGLGVSIKEAWIAMSALQKASVILAVVSTAWSVFSSIISKQNQKLEETRQKNIETAESASESADKLRNLYTEYSRLASIQDRTTSQEEEFKIAVENIISALGTKADVLADLTEGTEEYAQALADATKEELQNQAVNATVGRKAAEEELQDTIWDKWSGSTVTVDTNSKGKVLSDDAERAKAIVESTLKDFEMLNAAYETVSWDVSSKDPEDYLAYYNALKKAREDLVIASQDDDALLNTETYTDINTAINTMSESMDTYIKQRYEEEKLNYMAKNGVPSTLDEYGEMEAALNATADSSVDLQNEFKELLATDFSELLNKIEEVKNESSGNAVSTLFNAFTEEQIQSIDDFQSKVKTLGDALSSIQSGDTSAITDLVKEFPELSVESYKLEQTITDLINNTLNELYDTLGENLPTTVKDDLQSIADAATGTVPKLEDAFSKIQKSYDTMHEFKDAMDSDNLTDSILSNTGALSTTLNNMVAGFYAGTVSADQLYQALTEHYNNDLQNYGNALIAKNQYSEEFYSAVGLANTEVINQFMTDYGIDLKNCKSYNEAKLKIEEQTLTSIAKAWSQYYRVQYDAQSGQYDAAYAALQESAAHGDAMAQAQLGAIQGQLDKYQEAIDALNQVTYEGIGSNFNKTGSKIGSNSNSSSSSSKEKEETIETFNFIETLLSRLSKVFDRFKSAGENTFKALATRANAYSSALSVVTKQLETQNQAYNAYMERAYSVGLDEYWAAQVRDGSLNIVDVKDDGLKEKIKAYQEW